MNVTKNITSTLEINPEENTLKFEVESNQTITEKTIVQGFVSPLMFACAHKSYDTAGYLAESLDLAVLPQESVVWLMETAVPTSDINLIQCIFNNYQIDVRTNLNSLYKLPFYAAMIGNLEICNFLLENATDWMLLSAPKEITIQKLDGTKLIVANQYQAVFDVAEEFKHKEIANNIKNIKGKEIWDPLQFANSPKVLLNF